MISRWFRPCPAFVLAALLFAFAPTADAASFHGPRFGYTIDLPDNWSRIADADLRALVAAAQNANARSPLVFDAAFQLASRRRPFEYPYVTIEVLPYSSLGLNRQINEDEFPDVMRGITGTNVAKSMDAQLSPRVRSLISDPQVGQPHLETTNRRFWMTTEVKVAGYGNVCGLRTGYFGRDAIVQVCYYAPAAEWDRHSAVARQICDSLRYDFASQYSVAFAQANPSHRFDWTAVGAKGVAGALAGGVIGLLKYAASRSRKSNHPAPPPPFPPALRR